MAENEKISGWYPSTTAPDYYVFIDTNEKHSGTKCASIKSIVDSPQPFGNITQSFEPDEYFGHRMRMTAWVKTKLVSGVAQLWLRVDGGKGWKSGEIAAGKFDNMNDRPILGDTEWQKYELVVDVDKDNTAIVFGLMLIGAGQIWLDDVSFEKVGTDVPLTGSYAGGLKKKTEPINLNFED